MFSSDEQIWAGAVLSTKNARSLHQAAKLLHTKGSRGHAASLLILCAEECAKALALGQYLHRQITTKELNKVFFDHKFKQNAASNASSVMLIAAKLLKSYPAIPTSLPDESEILQESKEWLEKAETLKKNGFYVGHKDGQWISPSKVTAADFEDAEYRADLMLVIVEAYFLKGSLQEFKTYAPKSP